MTQFTDNPNDYIEAKLLGRHRAFIHRIDASLHFDEPVYAVNWFNTRSSWLYELYNSLAAGSVKAIGGAPFFKGRLVQKLHGAESDSRNMILVVRYPALTQFKSMLENKYFQLISLLRLFAVKQFTFGFTKRRDRETPLETLAKSSGSEDVYLVHHFKGDLSIADDLIVCGREVAVDPVFIGTIGAVVSTGTSTSYLVTTPCLMDAIVIFKAPDKSRAEALFQEDRYQTAISKFSSSFVGVYERSL